MVSNSATLSKKRVYFLLTLLLACPGWLYLLKMYLQGDPRFSLNILKEDISMCHSLYSNAKAPNCTLLFEGDQDEIKRINLCKGENWVIPSDDQFFTDASKCDWIKTEFARSYYVSEKEKNFSLAFALNVHNSPQQIFRFLKVIYRPHNLYCIHYDQKSDKSFKNLMITMSECLPNVIVPRKIEDVVRSWHTVVDAQMNCMSDLYALRDRYPWKYVTTLCGKEVPLRTNREMVETLMKLNGTSAIRLVGFKEYEKTYWKYKSVLKEVHKTRIVELTGTPLGPVPFNIVMAKSYTYYGLSVAFVDFLLHNETAMALRKFTEDTHVPEEHLVPSLFNLTGVPGGRDNHYTEYIPSIIWCIWAEKGGTDECSGDVIHSLCIINSGDLHRISPKKINHQSTHQTFFFNKFFIERDRVVMDCAEQELVRRNKEERHSDKLNH